MFQNPSMYKFEARQRPSCGDFEVDPSSIILFSIVSAEVIYKFNHILVLNKML